MNFLNPFALFGLIAASIPIVLHLLNLRKLKIIEFSSLKFLKELQKTKIRRLKVKQIILLILRTLAIIFVIISFARPAIEGTIPGFSSYAKTSTIILIDNSFSMDVSDESGNRFTQARNSAMSILNSLRDGDEAAIIELANGNSFIKPDFTRNFMQLKEKLSNIKISYKKANLHNSLRLAAGLTDKANNINKEIFIISDAQKNIFIKEMSDSLKLFSKEPAVYFVKVGANDGNAIVNASIDSINVMNRIFQYNKLVEVEAKITNSSSKDLNGLVVSMFFNQDRVAQRNLDIPAKETRTINISASPQQYGLVRARINIEDDALNTDNNRHFGFLIPDKPKAALIGKQKDLTFIKYILKSNTDVESPADADLFEPNQIQGINLSDYELLILAGGPYLKSDFMKISQFIRNGGACFIFADETTEINTFKENLNMLGFGNIKERNYPDDNPGVFTIVDKVHPLFEGVFKGTTDSKAIVESPRVFRALLNDGGQSVISMTGGNFLSETKLGDGKAIYCSVTPGSSWSSLPLTGLFPTIIYRSIIYLSAREGLGRFATAGEPLMISLAKRFSSTGNFRISDPNKKDMFIQAAILPSGAVLSLTNLDILGVYAINSVQERIVDIISVNPPISESNLETADDEAIIKNLEDTFTDETKVNVLNSSVNIINNVNRLRSGTEMWQLFLILAIAALIAEMLVARNTRKEAQS